MKKHFINVTIVIGTALTLTCLNSCQCNKTKKKPDLSGIPPVRLDIQRFERDFFTLYPEQPKEALVALLQKYPVFAPFYFEQIMGFGAIEKDTDAVVVAMSVYRNDNYVREVADTVLRTFADFSDFEKQLAEAFRYCSYYFPNKKIPQIITFTGNFSLGALSLDTFIVGIGVDMYLGEKYKFYPSVFPRYMYEKFKPEYLVPNAMNVTCTMFFNIEPQDNSLLSAMIAEGIKLYFLDLVLPDTEDHLKIGYNKADIEWCKKNEPEIWTFFVKNDLLFKTEQKDHKKFIHPAPNTSGMPVESPGRVGVWTGWQIVRKYMELHPNASFEELLKLKPTEILNKSKYKPKR